MCQALCQLLEIKRGLRCVFCSQRTYTVVGETEKSTHLTTVLFKHFIMGDGRQIKSGQKLGRLPGRGDI